MTACGIRYVCLPACLCGLQGMEKGLAMSVDSTIGFVCKLPVEPDCAQKLSPLFISANQQGAANPNTSPHPLSLILFIARHLTGCK